jgi:uncharacterized protein GlcG (DUF336 family)
MGYNKFLIGVEESQSLLRFCMEHIKKEPGEPVAVAIVDDAGNLVSCLRMDSAKPFQLELAICKAFTASIGEISSSEFGNRDQGWGRELANYHEKRFTHIAGGVPIKISDDESGKDITIGGIGVSGRMPEDDERIAFESVKSIART